VSIPDVPSLTASRRAFAVSALVFAAAWLLLSSPWLAGEYTIPYDAKAHFHAQIQFLANALHSGQSPFWAPHVFAGTPQIADPQSMIFSPAILLAYLDPEPSFRMVDSYVFGLLGVGGLSILMLFRDRGWHPAGGVVAALAFAFGASAAWRVQHIGQIQSFALFAVALWLLLRALDRGALGYGAAAGLMAGMMIVEPNQVGLLGCYVLAGVVAGHVLMSTDRRHALRRMLRPLGIGAVVGAMVVFIPVLLTYLFISSSSRPEVLYADAARGSLHPASLLTAVVGDLYGAFDPQVDYWGPSSIAWNPDGLMLAQNMSQLYFGALPALLILSIGFTRRMLWAREIRVFAIAAAVLLVYALGIYTPVFRAIYDMLPGVHLFRRPADATFMLGGMLSMLGGYLVHRWVSGTVPSASPRLLLMEGALVAAVFAAAIAVAVGAARFADAREPIMMAFGWWGAALLFLRLVEPLARHTTLCVSVVAALVTADLAVNNGPNESTALPVGNYDILKRNGRNETIRLLKSLLKQPAGSPRRDRVELVGLGFEWPNAPLVHGFDHMLGYNPLRLEVVTDAIGAGDTSARPEQRQFTPLFPSYRSILADLLGLRLIATGVPIQQIDKRLGPGEFRLIARTKDAYVYENPRAMPRALFVSKWQWADFDALMRTGQWPQFDPSQTVLLDVQVDASELPLVDQAPAGRPARVRMTRYENTVVEIEVVSDTAGFVILNDVWHPWWRAEVDGQEVQILKANVLFRAIAVPAGRHYVRFEFKPLTGALHEFANRMRGAAD
jgi:hypothetical protein